MIDRDGNRSGFAMVTAMYLVAVAGVAIAAISALLAADVRRTLNTAADAQLRQLLLAAAVDAPSHLSDANAADWSTPVPIGGATVETHRQGNGDGIDLTVTATLEGRHAVQLLRLERDGERWQIVSAELMPSVTVQR